VVGEDTRTTQQLERESFAVIDAPDAAAKY
jgi:hypothetical protein